MTGWAAQMTFDETNYNQQERWITTGQSRSDQSE